MRNLPVILAVVNCLLAQIAVSASSSWNGVPGRQAVIVHTPVARMGRLSSLARSGRASVPNAQSMFSRAIRLVCSGALSRRMSASKSVKPIWTCVCRSASRTAIRATPALRKVSQTKRSDCGSASYVLWATPELSQTTYCSCKSDPGQAFA